MRTFLFVLAILTAFFFVASIVLFYTGSLPDESVGWTVGGSLCAIMTVISFVAIFVIRTAVQEKIGFPFNKNELFGF